MGGGGGGGGIEAVLLKWGPKGATNMKLIYKCILQGEGGLKEGKFVEKIKRVKMGGKKEVKCKSNWGTRYKLKIF